MSKSSKPKIFLIWTSLDSQVLTTVKFRYQIKIVLINLICSFLDPYVKLLLFHNEKRIAKRKTHVKRNTLNPTFNDTFDFDLPYEEDSLKNIQLDCILLDRDRTSKNTVVGHLAFGGEKCKGTALKHWSEIITFPSREVEEWHKLCD